MKKADKSIERHGVLNRPMRLGGGGELSITVVTEYEGGRAATRKKKKKISSRRRLGAGKKEKSPEGGLGQAKKPLWHSKR